MVSLPLFARFADSVGRNPGKTAVVADGARWNYGQLAEEVNALARQFAARGVQAGDPIGVILPNGIEFVRLLLAAARLGAVLVPQSPGSTRLAVEKACRAAGVRHIVCWHGAIGELLEGPPAGGIGVVVGARVPGWHSFDDLLKASEHVLPAVAGGGDNPPYLVLLTSGSTGAPKPILLGQGTKLARADSAIALYGLGGEDVVLAATPMYHSLAQRMVLIPLLSGGTSVIMRHYTPPGWLDTVARHRVTFTIAVSSQLRQIIPLLDDATRPATLRCLVSSSAALDAASKSRLLAGFGGAFHEIYGASEVASVTDLAARARPDKIESVGCAVPEAEVRILGSDGELCRVGEPGEIICRTPLMFSGYLGDPALTRAAMWQDYFRTGDEGRLDADGFLHFLGRIKDIVIVGGINVYPRDIEDVVETHPEVLECAAIAVDDERFGEVVGVVMAPRAGVEAIDMRGVRRYCASRLGDAQQPHHCFEVARLPRNEMGKIDKPALRARFSKQGMSNT